MDGDDLNVRIDRALERLLTPTPSELTQRDQELLDAGRPYPLKGGLAATAWGEGPTVLLAHGWQSRGTHWSAFIKLLTEAGYSALAVDAPAHGNSPGSQTNMYEFGLALLAAGREIGPLAGIVGHSFGAGASAIALHRGLDAKKSVFISGPATAQGLILTSGRRSGLAEHELEEFVRRSEERIGVLVNELDIDRLVTDLRQPALVIHDERDEDIPIDEGRRVAANWPGARLIVTDRFGHKRILVAREVVQATVAFLTQPTATHA